jgi:hypothetical protein
MAEVLKGIEKVLREKGVPTGEVLAVYNIPPEILSRTQDIEYDKGKLIVKIPLVRLANKLDVSLSEKDSTLLYIGDGAFSISLPEKTYWCDAIPKEYEKIFHSTMKELGYEWINRPLWYPKS